MDIQQRLRLASFAPSESAVEGVLAGMGAGSLGRYDDATLGEAIMGARQGRMLWKKGRSSAPMAALVAQHIRDPHLLSEMIQHDTRVSVRAAAGKNPAVDISDLVTIIRSIGWHGVGGEHITRRIHAEPLSKALEDLCRKNHRFSEAYVSHPGHTTTSLYALLQSDAGTWGGHVARRNDLLSHPMVVRHYQGGEMPGLVYHALARRNDLAQFPAGVLSALVRHGHVREVAPCPLTSETLALIGTTITSQAMRVPHQRQDSYLGEIWMLLAENPTVPHRFLRQAPVSAGTGPLGRLLAETHPDNAAAWEMVVSLQASSTTSTVGELLDAVGALML